MAATHTPQADKIRWHGGSHLNGGVSGSASTSSPPTAASPSAGRAPPRRRCPPAAGRTPTSTGRASTTTRRCSASRPEPAPAPAKPAAALPQVAYVVVFETGGSPWEAAVGPTFGFGRPKCRIFVSHALVGKIAQDHVTTDAAGPTPSIDDDPTTKRRGAPGSDHRPVPASINVIAGVAVPGEPPGARSQQHGARRADPPRGSPGAVGTARNARRRSRRRHADFRAGSARASAPPRHAR